MRKVLSIVLALLMVSMMIPSMAFADGNALTLVTGTVPTAALVATESFTLTANEAVTVKVNASVFDLGADADVNTDTNIETLVLNAPGAFTVTVEDAIPAEEFESTIRVEAGETKENIKITIKDRLIGDVTGNGIVDLVDATDIMAYVATIGVSSNFNLTAGDATRNGDTDLVDATDIMAYVATLDYTYPDLGKADSYIGGKVTMSDLYEKDPTWETTTPEVIKLTTPTIKTAIAQNGIIYYELDAAVADAEAYEFYVGETLMATKTEISGSFKYAYTPGMEITVVATTTKANYEDSEPSAAVPVEEHTAPTGTLEDWLKANDLEGVTITVHNISAE